VSRSYNFSAGPAVLPEEVLHIAQQELCDFQQTGSSVMEISHRGVAFEALFNTMQENLRTLMNIPKNYRILFLQGGARLQFAMIPLNLAQSHDMVDYVNTGYWSQLAIEAAKKHAIVNEVASNTPHYTAIPEEEKWHRNTQAVYLHFTTNETIHGVQFPAMPTIQNNVPLVCDMSSDFMSQPIDVNQFGLIYAGAQKNIGIAGLTIVIIREDLLAPIKRSDIPKMLQYATYAETNSMYNTPPTFAIYMAGLVFEWLKKQGGVAAIKKRNDEKAAWLYHIIDQSNGFYRASVQKPFRSCMNVVFRLADEKLNSLFLETAQAHRLMYLKGHPIFGGMRASIYNAMPMDGVKVLGEFMQTFAKTHNPH
jgi:phosphoserine aminotransferase